MEKNDTPQEKKTLSLSGKKLTLSGAIKTPGTEYVRQNLSHGQSKAVTVEVKRKRGASQDKDSLAAKVFGDNSLLTEQERKARQEILERAKKDSLELSRVSMENEPLGNNNSDGGGLQITLNTSESSSEKINRLTQESVTTDTAIDSVLQNLQEETSQSDSEKEQPVYKESKKGRSGASFSRSDNRAPVVFTAYELMEHNKPKKEVSSKTPEKFREAEAKTSPGFKDPKSKVVEKKADSFQETESFKKKTKKSFGGGDNLSFSSRRINHSNLFIRSEDDDFSFSGERPMRREKRKNKHKAERQQAPKIIRDVIIPDFITVSDLAKAMAEKTVDVIKKLMGFDKFVTANENIDADTAELLCIEFGHRSKRISSADIERGVEGEEDAPENLTPRPPVVTVMGHVDHGKTSLLDALRKTDVVKGEAGGITQHIGAYQITMKDGGKITFIDTPGHAAFSEMRARGANITDIVVLVVAADDSVNVQTIEAINHAKAAGVEIIVAINKMDKPDADPGRVMTELLSHGVVSEEYGGQNQIVKISAKTGLGLEDLEKAILLQAEVMELKANPNRPAQGVVIESRVEKGRGNVATVLVQKGTLKNGDVVIAGCEYGKVRTIVSDHGSRTQFALPSSPVEITGLGGSPEAGDRLSVVESESKAREICEYRKELKQNKRFQENSPATTVEDLVASMTTEKAKELSVIIKGDVQGSIEAIKLSLTKLSTDEVKLSVKHSAVSPINESDVKLAKASDAIIIGFNTEPSKAVDDMAKKDQVQIKTYKIIYEVIDDIKLMMGGLLAPIVEENLIGSAEIRNVISISKVGNIAGCMVSDGSMKRGSKVKIKRNNKQIFEGNLQTLKRFKDDVKEVARGYECGMAFDNFNDIQVGDIIECYEVKHITRQL